jgi:hypothetical protein
MILMTIRVWNFSADRKRSVEVWKWRLLCFKRSVVCDCNVCCSVGVSERVSVIEQNVVLFSWVENFAVFSPISWIIFFFFVDDSKTLWLYRAVLRLLAELNSVLIIWSIFTLIIQNKFDFFFNDGQPLTENKTMFYAFQLLVK